MDPETFGHDIHNVTGLLKVYFKQLSDPLLTYDKLDDFVAAARKYSLDCEQNLFDDHAYNQRQKSRTITNGVMPFTR